jgi:gas vesicle protein
MVTRDVLIGAGIGAAVAFIADPQSGRRRRALARDQFVHASRKTRDALDATARDVANRTSGIVAATRSRLTDRSVDDRRLLERVRARLGRASSHPRAIDVDVCDRVVTLRGPILANEVDDLLAAVGSIPGVASVANDLEPHLSSDGVPALQGEARGSRRGFAVLRRNWPPATQALMTAASVAATAVCMAAYARHRAEPRIIA